MHCRPAWSRGVAQPGSASALGAEGRVFESRRPDHFETGDDMRARIYKPAKNAMQSGKARTKMWVLEFEPERAREIDPLMGWTSSTDMRQQVQLEFDTADEAIAYAKGHNIPFDVFEPLKAAPKAKSYADNFRFDRKVPWSH